MALDIKATVLLSILFIATITQDGVLHNNLQVREEVGVILGIVFGQMKLKHAADSILFAVLHGETIRPKAAVHGVLLQIGTFVSTIFIVCISLISLS